MKAVREISKKWLTGIQSSMFHRMVTACMNDDDDNAITEPIAFVSLYHGSPNAPDSDVEVDNRQINTYPLEYTDYTGYLRFYTGERKS